MSANLSNCQIDLILQLTSIYETSSPSFDYAICTTLDDNHGYSAGMIQFTTGSGSAISVIQEYTGRKAPNPTPFTPLNSTLQSMYSKLKSQSGDQQVLDGSLIGLDGFCNAWETAATNPEFKEAQLAILGDMYLAPAINIAQTTAHLTMTGSIGQIYDSVIQLGQQGTLALISATSPQPSSYSSDTSESQWMTAFISARTSKLQSMGPVYAATVTRVESYTFVLKNNQESDWKSGKITALNNDGNVIELKCDPDFQMPVFSLQSSYPTDPNAPFYSGTPALDVGFGDLLKSFGNALIYQLGFFIFFVAMY